MTSLMSSAIMTPLNNNKKPDPSSPPADSNDQWSSLESIIQNRRRNSLLGSGHKMNNIHDEASLRAEVNEETASKTFDIKQHCNEPTYRQTVLEFLFRHFASWNAGENASYISRTSWRQACREMKFKNKRFVHGDIEVTFMDALMSSPDGGVNQTKRSSRHMNLQSNTTNKAKKRRPLLNYRQFVMGLQLVAIKRYGATQYQHLDPRYVVLANTSSNDKTVEPFHNLYHKRLLTSAIRFGLLEETENNKPGGIATSPRESSVSGNASSQPPYTTDTTTTDTTNTNTIVVLQMDLDIDNALKAIQIDRKALKGLFNVYALSDLSNGTGTFADSGLSFDEFAAFARDCELVPRFCSLSDLIVIFRENRVLHQGDFNLEYTGKAQDVAAHMLFHGFARSLATVAVRFVRRDTRGLHTSVASSSHHLIGEGVREKVLLLLKQIANSRGVKNMALRPRRYAHVRFVSRMNGFQ